MTKKSQGRQQRDRASRANAQAAASGVAQQPQIKARAYRPANIGGFKPTENGGFKLTAADRILAECRQGAGAVPGKIKNTCWDDLMGVYREAASMLYKHTMVSQLLADKDLIGYVDDLITFNLNVKQFAADLGQINRELQEILAQHAGKTGGSDDAEVVLASFAIYEQYKLWMTRHDGVITPTVMHILEQTNGAEFRRTQAHLKASEGMLNAEVPIEQYDAAVLDVNTISDVQFQEVKSADEIVVNPNAKPLRGAISTIGHLDEAAFMAGDGVAPKIGEQYDAAEHTGIHAHHLHHGKNEQHVAT